MKQYKAYWQIRVPADSTIYAESIGGVLRILQKQGAQGDVGDLEEREGDTGIHLYLIRDEETGQEWTLPYIPFSKLSERDLIVDEDKIYFDEKEIYQ